MARPFRRGSQQHGSNKSYWKDLLTAGSLIAAIFLYVNRAPTIPISSNLSQETTRVMSNREETKAATNNAATETTTIANNNNANLRSANALAEASHEKKSFYEIALQTGTDKVWGPRRLEECLQDPTKCRIQVPGMENDKCRTGQGHYYHTMYDKWLGKYSTKDAEPFQFLEVGFYNGKGYDAFKEFMPNAETHSIEIACIEPGPRKEGKWPWGNFASKNPNYQHYLDTNQLHCGDGSDYDFLHAVWTNHMKRPNAPPLKVVVDDGAHLAMHMATTLFFWFPRIEPGGVLIVEDIQPIEEANAFRTHVLPQVMKDVHYCGDPRYSDKACFPTIWPLLQSVHCEMHICVFERNQHPAVEYDKIQSMPPPNTFHAQECLFSEFKKLAS